MTSPGLRPGTRPVATCFRATRWRLAYVRYQERTLTALNGFRRMRGSSGL